MAKKDQEHDDDDVVEDLIDDQPQDDEECIPKWAKREDLKPIVMELVQNDDFAAELAHIRPSKIGYVAFSKKKSKKNAMMCPAKPMFGLFLSIDYILAVHLECWIVLDEAQKRVLVLHELLHIPPNGFDEESKQYRKTVDHDIKDFAFVLQRFGIHWEQSDKIIKVKDKNAGTEASAEGATE